MRLQLTFVTLLVIAASAVSLAWQDFSAARNGELGPRILVLGAFFLALTSMLLLSRIMVKTSRAPRPRKE